MTEHDILYYMKDFCASKSSGIPKLISRILLDFFLIKPGIMVIIFNRCLMTGIYPASWKRSIMVPIPKKNNPLYLRLISLVPLPGKLLGKLFEKILHGHLSRYFENNELLCTERGGFRRGLDTTDTIFDLVNYSNLGFNAK